jgi:hypothetical protein
MAGAGPDKWKTMTAEEERRAHSLRILVLTLLLNTLVLGVVGFAYSLQHIDTSSSPCGMALDFVGGLGECTSSSSSYASVGLSTLLVAITCFSTGVGLGLAGVTGWKGAPFAALGQPSIFPLLLISSALQAAAEFRLLALVAVLTLVTLPSMAGWSLQRLSLRLSPTR